MEDVFMFDAQPESVTIEVGKEKPPDSKNSAKRARSQEAEEGFPLRKTGSKSFKTKLLSASSPDSWKGFGTGKQKLTIEDGDISYLDGPNGTLMKLSEELKLKLCKPWENALILKRPNFVPREEEITRMPVWVRLSRLPMEWIDVNLLWKMCGSLGTTFKIDPITESQARGRFVRICVEIDTTKPLKSNINIEDKIIKVEYENLGLICFGCGRVGHGKEWCKKGIVDSKVDDKPTEEENRGDTNKSNPYGPWMQVSYGKNYKNNLGNKYGNRGIFDGKRNGYHDNVGKVGSSAKQDHASQTVGEDKKRQSLEHDRSLDSVGIDSQVKSSAIATKNNRLNFKKENGSRFAVLNDYVDVEEAEEELQGHT
ncbi:hypothetical protein Ddye_024302 [Dipteronia dyeriana]|uniref:Zinc knuckle CX2CX4HX4C domain-containing protein n=1 Tax=Dipteronia dyeriana TaxID=168575 RepID=A0AAD9WSU3_9ROSI|nr:hypothetical protein Ddye_024302 [Dipteronia dyeriana]